MLQSDLINITPNSSMSHPPPAFLLDELLLSSTHLISDAQPPSLHPAPPPPPPPPAKKKRSLPGHPEPGAEVIALSPKSLLATNRFMCEICNKGFQRDQNLQLHRRGHNLPWKLKQRSKEEAVRRKVYVCPEAGCVHNDPARALGDLTGIKKHFYRKHGEKKWKCDKCSKKYAVQSDWKAHSKTCGTKEYRCDCGTLFSRRDSFITHRAFCDALVEDTARALTSNPFLPAPQPQQQQQEAAEDQGNHQSPVANSSSISPHQSMLFLPNTDPPQLIPQQQQQQQPQPHPSGNLIPPWLQPPPLLPPNPPALLFTHHDQQLTHQPPLQSPSHGPAYPPPPPHLSATALLQKAAQLGAIISSKAASSTSPLTAQPPPPITAGFALNLSSYEQQQPDIGFFAQGCGGGPGSSAFGGVSSSSASSLLRDLMMIKSMPSFDGDNMPFGNGGITDGLTRDFLGLRPLIHHGDHDIVNLGMAGLGDTTNAAPSSSQDHQNQW